MTNEEVKRMRVRICDPEHPHFPEHGRLTGEVIAVLGTPMAKVKLETCRHGTDACFVKAGQIEAIPVKGINERTTDNGDAA